MEDNGPPGWSPKVTWEKSGQIRVGWWGQLVKGIENKRRGFLSGVGIEEGGYGVIRRYGVIRILDDWNRQHCNEGDLLTGCSTSLGED